MGEREAARTHVGFIFYAMGHVVHKDLLYAESHPAVVDEDVALEIVVEAAEVDIRRTARRQRVVADEQLRVVEAGRIKIHVDAGVDGLLDEGAAGPLNKLGVGMQRNQQLNVDTGQGGRAHGEHYRLGRQEVRRFHVDVALGLEQYAHVALSHLRPLADGAARHDLHDAVVVDGRILHGVVTAF